MRSLSRKSRLAVFLCASFILPGCYDPLGIDDVPEFSGDELIVGKIENGVLVCLYNFSIFSRFSIRIVDGEIKSWMTDGTRGEFAFPAEMLSELFGNKNIKGEVRGALNVNSPTSGHSGLITWWYDDKREGGTASGAMTHSYKCIPPSS